MSLQQEKDIVDHFSRESSDGHESESEFGSDCDSITDANMRAVREMEEREKKFMWYYCMDDCTSVSEAMQRLFDCDREQFYLNGEIIKRMLDYRYVQQINPSKKIEVGEPTQTHV
jgi:DNA integrity scanning protein DisA with diadenylate cyclase activity